MSLTGIPILGLSPIAPDQTRALPPKTTRKAKAKAKAEPKTEPKAAAALDTPECVVSQQLAAANAALASRRRKAASAQTAYTPPCVYVVSSIGLQLPCISGTSDRVLVPWETGTWCIVRVYVPVTGVKTEGSASRDDDDESNTSTMGLGGEYLLICQPGCAQLMLHNDKVFTVCFGTTTAMSGDRLPDNRPVGLVHGADQTDPLCLSCAWPTGTSSASASSASVTISVRQRLPNRRIMADDKGNIYCDRTHAAGSVLVLKQPGAAVPFWHPLQSNIIKYSQETQHMTKGKRLGKTSHEVVTCANLGYTVAGDKQYTGFPKGEILKQMLRVETAEIEDTYAGNLPFCGYGTLRPATAVRVDLRLLLHTMRIAFRLVNLDEASFVGGRGRPLFRARALAMSVLCVCWVKKYNSDCVVVKDKPPVMNDNWKLLDDSIPHEVGGDCEDFALTCYTLWNKLIAAKGLVFPNLQSKDQKLCQAMAALAAQYTPCIELIGMNKDQFTEESLQIDNTMPHCIAVMYPTKSNKNKLPPLFLDGTSFVDPIVDKNDLARIPKEELTAAGFGSSAFIECASLPGRGAFYAVFVSDILQKGGKGVMRVHTTTEKGVVESGTLYSDLFGGKAGKRVHGYTELSAEKDFDGDFVPAMLPDARFDALPDAALSAFDYDAIPPMSANCKLMTGPCNRGISKAPATGSAGRIAPPYTGAKTEVCVSPRGSFYFAAP